MYDIKINSPLPVQQGGKNPKEGRAHVFSLDGRHVIGGKVTEIIDNKAFKDGAHSDAT